MLPSGPSTPLGGAQPVPSSLLRSNSGMLGGQGGPMPSQGAYPSLIPPRPHYNNVNMLGNVPNAHSLLNQSFGNGVVDPGLQGPNGQNALRGGMDTGGAEPDSLSGAGMGYNPSQSSSFVPTNMVNAVSASRVQGQQFSDQAGNQMLVDQQPSNSQQLEPQNFQHPQQPMQPFSAASSNQPSQQQQFRSIRGGLAGVGAVKLESQVNNDQHGLQQQQLQSLRGLGHVKLEPQQLQPMRSQPHVKMESQNSEQSMFMQQQQQQLLLSRQTSQAAAAAQLNLLQQHRLLQLQQQQQQQQQQHQLLKAHPQQRPQMQQQFQAPNLPLRSPVKPMHEVGACARRVTQYIYQQRNRPEDNNIEFWRKFVAEFFAPNSKKKWCVSMYGSGRQTTGVFPQDVWHCEICNRKPGRGFEATFEVLPRLFKIKYESGTLEELLYVDMPREYHNSSGQIVLDYAKAIQESVFEQLRVVRDGQLRIVFSSDLKICSWEFCARRHEELIPRRLLIPQVSQLGAATQKYQAATQNASSNTSVSDLQGNCNMFLASAKQLAKALEVPSVNDLGYSKRYVRCLQISEVVNSMKDLIDYSRATGTGPIESLVKFPQRNASSGFQTQNQPSEDQQQQQLQQHPSSQSMQQHQQQQQLQQHPSSQSIQQHQQQQQLQQHPSSQSIQQHQQQQQSQMMQQEQPRMQNSNIEQASTSQGAGMQLGTTNGLAGVNNPLNTSSTSTPTVTISGHQNSTVSRPQNPMNCTNSPYATASMPSPVSTGTMQQSPSHSNPPFRSPTPPPSNNSSLQPPSNNALSNTSAHMNSAPSPANVSMQQQLLQQQSALMSNGDPTNSQSSVQKIIQEMMLSNQLNGTGGMSINSLRNDMKNGNGILPSNHPSLNGPNCLVGNGPTNSNQGLVFSGMGGVMGQAAMLNGVRAAMGGNPIAMNGRVGMAAMGREQAISHHQQQDLSNQLSGFGSVNGFNNVQFDWKPSP